MIIKVVHLLLTLSYIANANIRLPLHSLRDQASTHHCWAYATSHLLESRALHHDSIDFIIDVEQDTKYWVDYERLLSFYDTKNQDIYFGEYEGGWQIEFWNSFIKYGKSIYQSKEGAPEILYPPFEQFTNHLPFMPGPTAPHDPTLPSFSDFQKKVEKEFKTVDEAKVAILDFLNRYYGKPAAVTNWLNQEIEISTLKEHVLGADFEQLNSIEALVLVKPVTDGNHIWGKYLGERFWGYRYDKSKVLGLVEDSLKNGYPVTFDNVYHAMTIIGFETKQDGDTYYAVADSVPGKITWYDSKKMLSQLNLITFFAKAIDGKLPKKPLRYQNPGIRFDELDGTLVPPA